MTYTLASHIRTRTISHLRCAVAMMLCVMPSAFAHTSLEGYVREGIAISPGPVNFDISIQFSFPATLSLVERQRMDRDGDGTLSTKEQERYLNDVQAQAEQLLRFSVNGQTALLIPLEDPVLDLQDAAGVEAHPHELRLAYFARVPQTFGVGATVVLDSGLWTQSPLMISVSTEASDGIRFQTAGTQGLRQPSKNSALFRIAEARCVLWEPGNNKNGRQ